MVKLCPKCRTLIPASSWVKHQQEHANALKAPPAERGYGSRHRALKKQWAEKVAVGNVVCARFALGQCQLADRPEGPLILRGEDWELDHVDGDKSRYLGPSHRLCNRATAGR